MFPVQSWNLWCNIDILLCKGMYLDQQFMDILSEVTFKEISDWQEGGTGSGQSLR